MTEAEREDFWRDLGRPYLEELAEARRYVPPGEYVDELAPALERQMWEYLVQRRMARADLHGGEQ